MEETLKFCSRCGKSVPPQAQFCPFCGEGLAADVPNAPSPVQASAPVAVPAASPPVTPHREPVTQTNPPPPVVDVLPPPPPPVASHRTPPMVASTHVAPAGKGRAAWFLVPIILVVLAVVAWMLLSGFPRSEKRAAVTVKEVAVVSEGSSASTTPAEQGQIVEMPGTTTFPLPQGQVTDTTSQAQIAIPAPVIVEGDGSISNVPPSSAPRRQPQPAPTPLPSRAPPASTRPTPVPDPITRPSPPPPAPARAASGEGEEMDASTAARRLASFIAESDYYGDDSNCIDVSGGRYSNRGYVLQTVARGCDDRDDGVVDRWRVDSLTGEVFRQRGNGRFLRP